MMGALVEECAKRAYLIRTIIWTEAHTIIRDPHSFTFADKKAKENLMPFAEEPGDYKIPSLAP